MGKTKRDPKPPSRILRCSDCDMTIRHPRSLFWHAIDMHSGTRIMCEWCREPISLTMFASKRHLCEKVPLEEQSLRGGLGRRFECDECGKPYPLLVSLFDHLAHFHKQTFARHKKPIIKKPIQRKRVCDRCDTVIAVSDAGKRLMWQHYAQNHSHELMSKKASERTTLNGENLGFVCDICDKAYLYKLGTLKAHMTSAHSLGPVPDKKPEIFECDFAHCWTSFIFRPSMINHLFDKHRYDRRPPQDVAVDDGTPLKVERPTVKCFAPLMSAGADAKRQQMAGGRVLANADRTAIQLIRRPLMGDAPLISTCIPSDCNRRLTANLLSNPMNKMEPNIH